MSWRDRLQKGSYRGAPFLWQKADGELGRKTARHDYPLRDEAYVEDLGKAPREFTLEVFVLGPDYMAARDRLIAALEEPGPGTLVHPTMGTLRVALAGKARLSESTDEGGMARFTLPFVLAGENKFPAAAADTAGAVATRADVGLGKVADDFGRVVTVDGKPGFVVDDLQAMANTALERIDAVRAMLAGPLVPAEETKYAATFRRLSGAVTSLIRTPLALVAEFQDYMTGLASVSENPLDVVRAYRRLFDFGSDFKPVPRTTANRVAQADNRQAMVDLVRRTAVIEAARLSARIDYPSHQEAVAMRDELADRLDEQMEAAAADEVYTALLELRVAVVRDITARGADLARITSYTPGATLPSLVVAHRLYGDPLREAEVCARNRIRHPGFVTGGRPLEVLTNA